MEGCPPGIDLEEEDIQTWLNRRRPGRIASSSPRKEDDIVKILSGTFQGKTTGTPISLIIENMNVDSSVYEDIKDIFRPGHGDFTYFKKYGIRDYRGGGKRQLAWLQGQLRKKLFHGRVWQSLPIQRRWEGLS